MVQKTTVRRRGAQVLKKGKEARKQRRKLRNTVTRVINGPRGAFIAPSIQTKLKYHARVTKTSTTGVGTDHIFQLNSIQDPDYTGGGHQPMGHDQLSALYGKYRVTKVDVTIRMIKTTDSVSYFGAMIANNLTTSMSGQLMDYVAEQPDITYKISPYSVNASVPIVFKKSYDLAKITGVSATKYNSDDLYSSAFGASPTENIMLHVFVVDIAEASTVVVHEEVSLVFHITCYDPVAVGQS